MNVGIVGFDREGRASYEYFKNLGATITICDQNPDITVPDGAVAQLGPEYLQNLDQFDIIMRTPGVHPSKIVADNPTVADKISSCTNEFLKACPTKNIIGVTGTKGKGTTSTLITKMLEAAGKTVHLGGNIGVPALSMLPKIKPEDWVVLELSNFQLIDIQRAPHIAVCLLVVPEHLDWHKDYDEYTSAKTRLFAMQSASDIAVYYAENEISTAIASATKGQKVPYFNPPGAIVHNSAISIDSQEICKTDELKLLGEHNWQNACAAVTAAWQVTQDIPAIQSALTSFSGLPHRIEYVRTVDDIRYYNDSFATGLHATEAAISAVPGPIVEIIGGYERYLPLEKFASFAAKATSVRQFVIIGACANRLLDALNAAGVTNAHISDAKTMDAIVAAAQAYAKPGDAILLSPGFASFGLFNNFEERGTLFQDVVSSL